MRKTAIFSILLLICWVCGMAFAGPIPKESKHSEKIRPVPDSTSMPYLVWVEGLDAKGVRKSLGIGVVLKKGFVGVNYHLIPGMGKIQLYQMGNPTPHAVTGYLSVNEPMDMIILSAPTLDAPAPVFYELADPIENGASLTMTEVGVGRKLKFVKGTLQGKKDIRGKSLGQIVSTEAADVSQGPIFFGNMLYAVAVAGYRDDRYYSYFLPALEFKNLLKRSFIIKDFNSLSDSKVMAGSIYQVTLMESLTNIIWTGMNEAIGQIQRKPKKIMVHIYAKWNGWCKLMADNTFTKKSIIRYLNENYVAVKLDGESKDTYFFQNQLYKFNPQIRSNDLAWSLLNGKLEYPATVILDEKGTVLTVIPGYIEARRFEAILAYFNENAHQQGIPFVDFEREYKLRKTSGN